MCANENCRVGVFFLIFDRVLSLTGRLSKFKPRDSESESDSTYTKSELFTEETSEKEVESFRLGEEELIEEFRLVSISVVRVVRSELGLHTQSGLHAKQIKGVLLFSSKWIYWVSVSLVHLGNPDFNGSFITEDLTQFRSKLLWFVKKKCGGKFVNCHTRNGEIYAQLKDAQGHDDDFITIKSPEDLFKYDIDVDFNLINDNYLRFSVLEPLDTISVKNSFEQLLEAVQVPT